MNNRPGIIEGNLERKTTRNDPTHSSSQSLGVTKILILGPFFGTCVLFMVPELLLEGILPL